MEKKKEILACANSIIKKDKAAWLKKNKDQFEILGMSLPGAILMFMFCYMPIFGIVLENKEFIPIEELWLINLSGLSNF